MTEPALAIAVSAREWPDRLRQWLADHGGARVRLTALTARDVEEDGHDVLVIDDISSILTRSLVTGEHARGRRVIGVYDPAEPAGRTHLMELGVDVVLAEDESAERFVNAAGSLRAGSRDRRPSPGSADARPPEAGGKVVAVHGVSGGVGTTEVAFALCGALDGGVVVEIGPRPSLAQRFALDLHPNIVTAAEIVDHGDGDLAPAVQQLGATGVLVGADEARPAGRGAVRRVIEGIRRDALWTVVDGGADVTVPVPVDHTIWVTAATPVGIGRSLDLFRHHDLVDTHLVLNRAPRGTFERAEILHAVLDEIRPRSVTIVPDDPSVGSAAWNGRPVDAGRFTKAVAAIAVAVAGPA